MIMLINIELGEQTRKVLLEVVDEVEMTVTWVVGYIANGDDRFLDLEFGVQGRISFPDVCDAITAFENYKV